jgi:electron transfer flavoprotein alpha subunit
MSGVLVVAETRRGELRDVTFELIGAAGAAKAHTGGQLKVAIFDSQPDRFAGALGVAEVDEILLVTAPSEHFEAHSAARAIELLIDAERPKLVLVGHTVDGFGLAPAVAARQGLGFATDVTAFHWEDGELVAMRGAYGDKLRNELEFSGKDCTLLTLRPGTFVPAATPAHAHVRTVVFDLDLELATEHLGFRDVESSEVDITKAPFLLSVGRGIEDQQNLARFEELADRFGAVLSVSRPLVDAGWAPSALQVGQSGHIVKPRVYMAFGISGAVQHLAGMRGADTIIAVNADPEAPIFGVADYGAVADMFELADELERALS